jgi:hypothetical protein
MNVGKAAVARRRIPRRLCSLALMISVTGCFKLPTFAPHGVALSATDSNVLCEALPTIAKQGPHAFRALLETSLVTPDNESFSFRYAIARKQPDSLRVDLLPTEGAYTLGLLVVQNGTALVIDSQAKTYSLGCAVNDVFERFFSLQGVSPDVVQALVTGTISGVSCDAAQVYRQEGGRLLLVDARTRHAWELDEQSGKVLQIALLDSSLSRIQAKAARTYYPDAELITVEIHKPVTARATMKVRKLMINPEISDSLFVISPPAGYEDGGC